MMMSDCLAHCLEREYPFFDIGARALDVFSFMLERGYDYVPVLEENRCVSILSVRSITAEAGGDSAGHLALTDLVLEPRASISIDEHLYAFFLKAQAFPEPIIPVAEHDGTYAGIVRKDALLERMASIYHLDEECVTLELEVPAFGLKVSEVIGTLEKNDATVVSLGSYRPSLEGEGRVLIFRLYVHDPYRLVKNMENYGYVVRYASPLSGGIDDDLRERAQEFIRYLDL